MKKLGKCIVISLISVFLITPFSYACVGARPMSMGGAFIAVSDDANATYWNPAGLTQLEKSEFTYTPTLYNRDEFNYDDFVSFVTPLGVKERNWGSLGLSFVNSGYAWEIGQIGGTDYFLKYIENWYWLSYGVKTFDSLSLGTNLRYQSARWEIGPGFWEFDGDEVTLDDDNTFAMDLALLWKLDKFSFGILWQDMNEPELELLGIKSKYVRNLRPGIAFRPDDKTVIALDMYDATGETDGDVIDVSQDLRIGIERWFTKNFALRAGAYHFNSDTDATKAVTFGVGLKGSPEGGGVQLDYALLYWTDAASGDEFTHQIGLTFKF